MIHFSLKFIIASRKSNCGSLNTPFLEYQVILELCSPGVRSARGYHDSTGIWEKLEEIRELAQRVGVRDKRVRKDILAVGPCPGPWRIYYAATDRAVKEGLVKTCQYLGNQIRTGISQRDLGMMYDEWIKEANEHYNTFLEKGSLDSLEGMRGVIGAYYLDRAKKHCTKFTFEQRSKTKLLIKPQILDRDFLRLTDLTPDGVFSDGSCAAIFEAKLSSPTYREFPYEMAVYAIAYERKEKKDVDYAIVLYSDYPHGCHLLIHRQAILDSHVSEVASNIERFLRLAQGSEILERNGAATRISWKTKSGHRLWKNFLQRPPSLPDESNRMPCPSCKYRSKCYREGGER